MNGVPVSSLFIPTPRITMTTRPANFSVTVANVNVPEPSQMFALVLGLALIERSRIYRFRNQR